MSPPSNFDAADVGFSVSADTGGNARHWRRCR